MSNETRLSEVYFYSNITFFCRPILSIVSLKVNSAERRLGGYISINFRVIRQRWFFLGIFDSYRKQNHNKGYHVNDNGPQDQIIKYKNIFGDKLKKVFDIMFKVINTKVCNQTTNFNQSGKSF